MECRICTRKGEYPVKLTFKDNLKDEFLICGVCNELSKGYALTACQCGGVQWFHKRYLEPILDPPKKLGKGFVFCHVYSCLDCKNLNFNLIPM